MNISLPFNWKTGLRQLRAFQRAFGHLRDDEQRTLYPELAGWLSGVGKRLHTLAYDQILSLDKLGFFSRLDHKWLDRYAELRLFKKTHKHCDVPQHWQESRPLGLWVCSQRARCEKMKPWRVKLLDDIGFTGDPKEALWLQHYEGLKQDQQKHGHCNPARAKSGLGKWVEHQRTFQRRLPKHRKKLLDQIGFAWGHKKDNRWMERYSTSKARSLLIQTLYRNSLLPVRESSPATRSLSSTSASCD